ncbi:uncharacterized protein K452DRAFT_339790 [Aplosporella prunicola CBS 121167]|uniref:Uncharacterized protein n=1 Tax=Aplosporella prunicola CBS 121167 TaxID=1176127 RepID=A0A6A6B437_9PEZI|nr:uncharacterized protein K452DRAFT_339790 [Aplosporella prunicola CBS 121167]KAF2137717.1 hypothetical protein K452DRAFT_339790 [Aplosporella prunicola CBS 121167]
MRTSRPKLRVRPQGYLFRIEHGCRTSKHTTTTKALRTDRLDKGRTSYSTRPKPNERNRYTRTTR